MEPDDELIRRINSHDNEAIEELVRIYGRQIRYVALLYLKRHMLYGSAEEQAEEAMQDLYLDLCRKGIGAVDESLPGKLVRMARNKARDRVSKIIRESQLTDSNEDSFSAIGPNQETLMWREERSDALWARIRKLPPLDQQIIELWMKGHSYAEIGSSLEVPVSTVKARKFRVMEKLSKDVELRERE
jgi:RNA polymerase sigma factor (sigma-70 family)